MPWDAKKDTGVGRTVSFFRYFLQVYSMKGEYSWRQSLEETLVEEINEIKPVNSSNCDLKEWTDGLYVTGSIRIKISTCVY